MRPERKVLPNGTVLLAVANRSTPSVELRCLLPAGSVFDGNRPGQACLAARLLDAGSERRTRSEIHEELDFLGATLEIDVDRETVSLEARFLSGDLARVSAILGEVLARPAFPEEELEKERAALITSIRRDLEDTQAACHRRLASEIFPPGHPYRHPVKGCEEAVRSLTRPELLAFGRKFHGPEGAVLALSGDVEPAAALAQMEELAGGLTRRPDPPAYRIPNPDRLPRLVRAVVTMPDKAQADIGIGHRGIARSDPDYYPMLVLNNVLGQFGMGGRLGKEIRDKRGLAYYVYSDFEAGKGAGPFMVRAGVSPERVDVACQCVLEELGRVAAGGVTEQEVEESKRYLIGSLPRKFETNAGIAQFLASAEFHGYGVDLAEELPRLIRAVSASDCSRVAAERIEPDHAALVVAGPYAEGEDLTRALENRA